MHHTERVDLFIEATNVQTKTAGRIDAAAVFPQREREPLVAPQRRRRSCTTDKRESREGIAVSEAEIVKECTLRVASSERKAP